MKFPNTAASRFVCFIRFRHPGVRRRVRAREAACIRRTCVCAPERDRDAHLPAAMRIAHYAACTPDMAVPPGCEPMQVRPALLLRRWLCRAQAFLLPSARSLRPSASLPLATALPTWSCMARSLMTEPP